MKRKFELITPYVFFKLKCIVISRIKLIKIYLYNLPFKMNILLFMTSFVSGLIFCDANLYTGFDNVFNTSFNCY